jgi:hypothetical protein
MNNNELWDLKQKVEKAEKIKLAISNIDNILKELDTGSTRCEKIDFEYWGQSTGGFGMEESEWCNCLKIIDAQQINISEQEFGKWFTVPLLNHLKDLKEKLNKDFNEIK